MEIRKMKKYVRSAMMNPYMLHSTDELMFVE